jgi:hypothetical protein
VELVVEQQKQHAVTKSQCQLKWNTAGKERTQDLRRRAASHLSAALNAASVTVAPLRSKLEIEIAIMDMHNSSL